MFAHGPNCLKGPISRARTCWLSCADVRVPADLSAADDRPIRRELVERVRREIADGSYETSEKLDIALDRLMWRLDEA
jgi:hypothetical protein